MTTKLTLTKRGERVVTTLGVLAFAGIIILSGIMETVL